MRSRRDYCDGRLAHMGDNDSGLLRASESAAQSMRAASDRLNDLATATRQGDAASATQLEHLARELQLAEQLLVLTAVDADPPRSRTGHRIAKGCVGAAFTAIVTFSGTAAGMAACNALVEADGQLDRCERSAEEAGAPSPGWTTPTQEVAQRSLSRLKHSLEQVKEWSRFADPERRSVYEEISWTIEDVVDHAEFIVRAIGEIEFERARNAGSQPS